jgi:uncharacterized protein YkwD
MNFFLRKISHFFIPHEENNYHAHSLHTSMLSAYLLIAVLLVFVSKNIPQFSNVLGVATDISISKLFTLTNKERERSNLPTLKMSSELSVAAEKKAEDMFKNDYWSHFGPHGESPWDFIKQSGYQYEYAGENLAKNFLFSQNVVDAWMNSPTHKENIVKKEYAEVGYAVKNGMLNGEETTLVVQMFGTPLIKQIEQTNKQVEEQQNIPMIAEQEKKPAILGQQNQGAAVNGKRFAYNINMIFIAFIVFALVLDFAFAAKLDILHLRGKHIAHLLFLGFISLGIVFILKQGAIL